MVNKEYKSLKKLLLSSPMKFNFWYKMLSSLLFVSKSYLILHIVSVVNYTQYYIFLTIL